MMAAPESRDGGVAGLHEELACTRLLFTYIVRLIRTHLYAANVGCLYG